MQFDHNILSESKSARGSLVNDLDPRKIKALFIELFGDVQFIGDEITKQEVIRIFGIAEDTADRHIKKNRAELEDHGYRSLQGEDFKAWRKAVTSGSDTLIDAGIKLDHRIRRIGLFTLPAALAFGLSLEHPTGRLLREAVVRLVQLSSYEDIRRVGKEVRRTFTDVLQEVYATGAPSSQSFDRWAATFTREMTKKALGISLDEFNARKAITGNFRDSCSADELEALEAAERVVVTRYNRHGAEGIKALYHDAIKAMEVFA